VAAWWQQLRGLPVASKNLTNNRYKKPGRNNITDEDTKLTVKQKRKVCFIHNRYHGTFLDIKHTCTTGNWNEQQSIYTKSFAFVSITVDKKRALEENIDQ